MRALVLVFLVTLAGCGSKGDRGAAAPGADPLSSKCEAACKADGATFESTREGQCVCAKTAPAEGGTSPEALATGCTAAACAQACAPNTCVGWRSTATGCRYSCLRVTLGGPKGPE